MRYGAKTDKGMNRSRNEDNFCMANLPYMPFALFAVADGVGGHKSGDVASRICAEHFADQYEQLSLGDRREGPTDFLRRVSQEANEEIIRQSCDEQHTDMGTTLVASAVTGNRIVTINFGDSRAYILSGGELKQITSDHTIYADFVRSGRFTDDEAKKLYGSNRITNALGFFACPTGDIFINEYRHGDKLILCSDGLTGMVEPGEIRDIALADEPAGILAEKLVDAANARGGRDNITVIVVIL